MIKVLLIDDEHGARQTLRKLLALHCPEVEIIGEADGVAAGIQLLQTESPDAVFLDIRMKDGSGFDLLDQFPKPTFQVLFTTAYDQFALKAFRYQAIDYLLKPIDPEELKKAVNRLTSGTVDLQAAAAQLSRLVENIKTKAFEKITLSTNEGLFILSLDRIIRLESSGNYTTFHTLDGEQIMIARTIKEYEDLLPSALFFRIHRSHIVNLQQVKALMKEEGGYLLSSDNARLPIARRKKEKLIEEIRKSSL